MRPRWSIDEHPCGVCGRISSSLHHILCQPLSVPVQVPVQIPFPFWIWIHAISCPLGFSLQRYSSNQTGWAVTSKPGTPSLQGCGFKGHLLQYVVQRVVVFSQLLLNLCPFACRFLPTATAASTPLQLWLGQFGCSGHTMADQPLSLSRGMANVFLLFLQESEVHLLIHIVGRYIVFPLQFLQFRVDMPLY